MRPTPLPPRSLTTFALAALAFVTLAAVPRASTIGFSNDGSRFAYALITPGEEGNTTLSGDTDSGDWESLGALARREGREIFWFRLDRREYLVRDAATLERAREITRPMREIGAKQGELGARQGRIGAQQGAIGARQGRVGMKQGLVSSRIARLDVAIERARRRGDPTGELQRQRRSLDDEMDALGDEMSELGRQMAPLGERQSELGRQQSELGRQQEAAGRRATGELRVLAEAAIRSGNAERPAR